MAADYVTVPPYDNAHPSHRIIFRTSGAPFLVDRIQLEEGSRASEFVRPQAITLNATTGAPAEIVTTSELPVSLKGAVSFALPPAVPLSVRLYLKNKIVAEEQLPVKESLVHFEFPCSFAETAGYYPCRIEVVDTQGKILARQSVPFVVAKPFVLPGDYYGIMSGAIELEALRRMGASVLRNNIEVWKEREAQGPARTARKRSPRNLLTVQISVYSEPFTILLRFRSGLVKQTAQVQIRKSLPLTLNVCWNVRRITLLILKWITKSTIILSGNWVFLRMRQCVAMEIC